ncbi:hypothetical protein HanRHA438_Chr14g0631091 [Helianthus annuus]|nr:hypothetical protein HanRHA438_Chr14g0631091 [Helianthus annuus]
MFFQIDFFWSTAAILNSNSKVGSMISSVFFKAQREIKSSPFRKKKHSNMMIRTKLVELYSNNQKTIYNLFFYIINSLTSKSQNVCSKMLD